MNVLLTGGSANGKSTFAEQLTAAMPTPRVYIATMIPCGDDGPARVERHRAQRADKGFSQTIERYIDIASVELPKNSTVLLECLCNLAANEMFELGGAGQNAAQSILADVSAIAQKAGNLIVVTNDVGSDGGHYETGVANYIDTLGEINARLAQEFDCVCELCCGIPLLLKGELP